LCPGAASTDDVSDIIPSRTTIERYKNLLACQHEANAGEALLSLSKESKATLHYDTTQRNQIAGEWVSIIIMVLM